MQGHWGLCGDSPGHAEQFGHTGVNFTISTWDTADYRHYAALLARALGAQLGLPLVVVEERIYVSALATTLPAPSAVARDIPDR